MCSSDLTHTRKSNRQEHTVTDMMNYSSYTDTATHAQTETPTQTLTEKTQLIIDKTHQIITAGLCAHKQKRLKRKMELKIKKVYYDYLIS